jgi:hypothetical protein
MIIAVAGRRIDAADSNVARFPLQNVPLVERRLDELFERLAATALVGSAACGADLLALTVADKRGMRRRAVLPFGAEAFRTTSVTDRPGHWGPVYDQVLAALAPTHDVIALDTGSEGTDAYVAANAAILREAATLAREASTEVTAVLVWEGTSRSDDDVTAAFGEDARERGWRVEQVMTL